MMTDDSKTTGLVREVSQRLTISARDTPTILDRRSLLKGLAVGATGRARWIILEIQDRLGASRKRGASGVQGELERRTARSIEE
jgi:hypothetical protein